MNCFVCIFLLTKRQKFGVVCHLFLGLNAVLNKYEIPNFDSICNVATLLLSCLQCGSLLVFDECIFNVLFVYSFFAFGSMIWSAKMFYMVLQKKFFAQFFFNWRLRFSKLLHFFGKFDFLEQKMDERKKFGRKKVVGFL